MKLVHVKVHHKVKTKIVNSLLKYKKDPKQFWKVVNKVWKGETSRVDIVLKNNDNRLLVKDDVADFMNSYYVNTGVNLAAAFIGTEGDVELEDLFDDSESFGNEFVLDVWSDESFRYLAKDINIYKSSNIANIRSQVLRVVFENKPYLLSHMVNKSLETGVVPSVWKTASVVPLPKTGDLQKVTNWRPISLLNLIGKQLEKVVQSQTQDLYPK